MVCGRLARAVRKPSMAVQAGSNKVLLPQVKAWSTHMPPLSGRPSCHPHHCVRLSPCTSLCPFCFFHMPRLADAFKRRLVDVILHVGKSAAPIGCKIQVLGHEPNVEWTRWEARAGGHGISAQTEGWVALEQRDATLGVCKVVAEGVPIQGEGTAGRQAARPQGAWAAAQRQGMAG